MSDPYWELKCYDLQAEINLLHDKVAHMEDVTIIPELQREIKRMKGEILDLEKELDLALESIAKEREACAQELEKILLEYEEELTEQQRKLIVHAAIRARGSEINEKEND